MGPRRDRPRLRRAGPAGDRDRLGVAAHLDGAWHREDPRGNKPGATAEFSLGEERLAFAVDEALGERDYPEVHVRAAAIVVEALRSTDDLLACGLPGALEEHADPNSRPPG